MIRRCTVGLLVAVLTLLPAGAVLAVATAGGQSGQDAQSSKRSPGGLGPSSPELEWSTVLEGYDEGTDRELTFDSAGHVLVQGYTEDAEALVAVNADDGTVAWTLNDVSYACGVAADADGTIYGQGAHNTSTVGKVLAIEAETGAITETYEPEDQDEPPITVCSESLRLADDGTLVVLGEPGFRGRMHAFDTEGGLDLRWTREYNDPDADAGGASGENIARLARPIISADGSAVYMCRAIPLADEPDPLLFERIDLATGEPGAPLRIGEDATCETRSVVAVDGGAVVGVTGAAYMLMRIDHSGGDPSIAWSTAFSSDEDIDESGFGHAPAGSLSRSGDNVVFRGAGSDAHAAVDIATGDLVWSYEATSFGSGYEHTAADAAGDLYITTFGGAALESFDGGGNRRWTVTPEEIFGEGTTFGIGFVTVGPDGDLFVRGSANADDDDAGLARVMSGEPSPGGPYVPPEGTSRVAEDAAAEPVPLGATLCRLVVGEADTARSVLLARDDEFADALAGAPLASDDSCILFTPGGPDQPLDSQTRAELDRVLADGGLVRILGGSQAVSQQVTDELTGAGYQVERLAGATRFQTAVEIARRVVAETPVVPGYEFTAMVAFGYDWPDSVTGGAFGAWAGVPVLLTGTDELHPDTAAALDELSRRSIDVLGGQAVVSEAVVGELRASDRVVQRHAGTNRMGTAVEIAEQLWGSGEPERNLERFTMVNLGRYGPGSGFAGWTAALAAAPLSAQLRAPQLGVYTDAYPQETEQFLSRFGGGDLPAVVLAGGVQVIDAGVEEGIRTTVGG